ncbi:MAG: DNA adenine methylase [Myxococcota bacterium]|jgi:DNA adenine methylase
MARPFLKWVGGKRQLLPVLVNHVPKKFGTFHEPFVGGGALFFSVMPKKAVLSDTNKRLIRTWLGVRNNVHDVIALLKTYPHTKKFFLSMRSTEIDNKTDAEVAAWMIYLNKTAYNGLYRVNRSNIFNVPFGSYKNPAICDENNLLACSEALQDTEILHEDFSKVLTRVRKGDFVYFDPPYVPLSATSMFTGYTAEGFGPEEQLRLRDVALELKRRGVKVLLSNSAAGLVRQIYSDNFEIEEVLASRHINCKAEGRSKITELIMR